MPATLLPQTFRRHRFDPAAGERFVRRAKPAKVATPAKEAKPAKQACEATETMKELIKKKHAVNRRPPREVICGSRLPQAMANAELPSLLLSLVGPCRVAVKIPPLSFLKA